MSFDNIQVPVGNGANIVAHLLSYTPQTEDSRAEIEWGFFNVCSEKQMIDIYPLFKPTVHYSIEQRLWDQVKQHFVYDHTLAYKTWHRDVSATTTA